MGKPRAFVSVGCSACGQTEAGWRVHALVWRAQSKHVYREKRLLIAAAEERVISITPLPRTRTRPFSAGSIPIIRVHACFVQAGTKTPPPRRGAMSHANPHFLLKIRRGCGVCATAHVSHARSG